MLTLQRRKLRRYQFGGYQLPIEEDVEYVESFKVSSSLFVPNSLVEEVGIDLPPPAP